ncbi:Imm21 family immunity protein [Streptomyces sp. NPDC087568]|uniref:Imm21 family immunity protein n=1 Tax=Streptomyces sp. NPDC087568 TaxID=3365799 RepID=UPI0038164B74
MADEPATSCYLPEFRTHLRRLTAASEAGLKVAAEAALADLAAMWEGECGTWMSERLGRAYGLRQGGRRRERRVSRWRDVRSGAGPAGHWRGSCRCPTPPPPARACLEICPSLRGVFPRSVLSAPEPILINLRIGVSNLGKPM